MENLHDWSMRMNAARQMFSILLDREGMTLEGYGRGKAEDKVYTKAIHQLFLDDLRNVERFMCGDTLYFRNFQKNKKGKLVSCEAYFPN